MYVSGTKIYDALAHAKQPDGTALCYTRGGKNDSSHLQPFPNSKATQMGFDGYPEGQSAKAERKEKLPYGRNTLLFGKLSRDETGFGQDRTFIKLESFGIGGLGNKIAHGAQYVKKVILGAGKPTKESNFNEKNSPISKIVSSSIADKRNAVPEDISQALLADLQLASKKGLTSLAKFITEAKTNNQNEPLSAFLEELENNISKQLEGKILKQYQMDAINHWKSEPENAGQSTLAYFMEHDQSAKEMILDLPNH
jgi:hypothetical protein